MSNLLDTDIKFLSGIGERRAALLKHEMEVSTFKDMLYFVPYKYIDRTKIFTISELSEESTQSYVQIKVRIEDVKLIDIGKRRLVASAIDFTGRVELSWFAGIEWARKRIEVGREYIIFGRPNLFNGRFGFIHPEVELPMDEEQSKRTRIKAIYSSTEKLNKANCGTKVIASAMANLWEKASSQINETLPSYLLEIHSLMPLREALYNIHFPTSHEHLARAQYRLKFEELFALQLSLLRLKEFRVTKSGGYLFPEVGEAFNGFYHNNLKFDLTGAQKRVLREIRVDTRSGRQMNRLLQGDVGSGKTVVAFMSMLLAVDNGYQAAIMAPTEILATQHFESISEMASGLGVNVALLTGSTKTKERKAIATALMDGSLDILIGTHALIEDSVGFKNLGLVVIDEQHRFGVDQRGRLWRKSSTPPHILVMSATPIPRTLAMTLYGDLDVSIIDELPPGRQSIITRHFTDARRMEVFGFMRKEIEKGRQVYVVYPLINESEKLDYKNIEDGYESITRAFPHPQFRTVIVHGKMRPEDKEFGMNQFKNHQADIMVATSVIEVGVNVPNASVMVIESAERFGLAQLHQLRGRVGRGSEQSYCTLMSSHKLSTNSRKRLEAMCQTTDGFELAELDLKLRGYGDIEGTKQSGNVIDLKIASLAKDNDILIAAREVAQKVIESDPNLLASENALLKQLIQSGKYAQVADYSQIS